MGLFDDIYIGGKHFNSIQEAIEYKKQHPEWKGIGQIIDHVGPGETVTFNSRKKESEKETGSLSENHGSVHIEDGFINGDTVTFGKGSRSVKSESFNIGSANGHTNVRKGSRNIILSNNGTVTINRGGKKYVLHGERLEKIDGQWYRDGEPVDWDELGGKYEERDVVSIEIHGDVQQMSTSSGDVTIHGSVTNLRTGSGDVECESAINVSTGSGDVHCKNITGMVSTGSGDIYG